jgi:ubiquinone/menaquinone biosynthesis C-methylase UbiE
MDFIKKLRCPITKNGLEMIKREEFSHYNIPEAYSTFGKLSFGLIDSSIQYFFPVFDDIIVLHEHYALYIGKQEDKRKTLSFDKQRVFDYYNDVNYKVKDSLKIYEDSPKWVDFREVSSKYIKNSFTKASQFYPDQGEYLLDIASGPIGLQEYMSLSDGYDYRICVDISINALIQAKINIEKAGKKGIFICGDITNIPIQDNSVDTVLSQHTLYHIPKNDQKTAVEEMYRVSKPNSKIVIIYSWFYHSWFMNLSLNFVQIYRILRHFAGKIYVRLVKSKPRLYFYPHSPRWFRKTFAFSKNIEFYCWRSTNKYFLDLYIHKWFFGEKILDQLSRTEDKHSKFMSTFGEYSAIVITKLEHTDDTD